LDPYIKNKTSFSWREGNLNHYIGYGKFSSKNVGKRLKIKGISSMEALSLRCKKSP
jgi:hypothetical protein